LFNHKELLGMSNFKGENYLIIGTVVFALAFLFGPIAALATTTVYLDLKEPAIYENDTFLVDLKVSSPDQPINVVEGGLTYDSDKLKIKEISTGGSLLTLWPSPPTFSNDKGVLNFTGGASDGFKGEGGEILKIIFSAEKAGGTLVDFFDGFSVFLSDGRGTKTNPWLRPLELNILKRPAGEPLKDEWRIITENDKNSPEPFEIIVSKNPSVFNGQYFISFFTTDKESGLDHYEIQEGAEPYTIGNSPYLLSDQTLKSAIKVKAVDKAGNERVIESRPAYQPISFYQTIWFWLTAVLLVILAAIFVKIIKIIIKKKDA